MPFACRPHPLMFCLPPSSGPCSQALSGAAGAVVRRLGSFDKWLERNKLLPELQRPIMDAAMAGPDGCMNEECKQVGGWGGAGAA
jgi:hypothetical protein